MLAEGCAKSLVELAVPGCRLTNISRLTSHTRRLQNLSFHSAKGIKDADMDALPSTLVWLDLSYCFFLTDVGIAKLADRCPNLISLSLKGCSNLTDEALAALGRGVSSLSVHPLCPSVPLCYGVTPCVLLSPTATQGRVTSPWCGGATTGGAAAGT